MTVVVVLIVPACVLFVIASDDYVLDIFDKNATLPAQCTAADPGNPLCQILGAQTLHLNDYNTKAPYTHMAEHCPSEAPLYKRPANC